MFKASGQYVLSKSTTDVFVLKGAVVYGMSGGPVIDDRGFVAVAVEDDRFWSFGLLHAVVLTQSTVTYLYRRFAPANV